MIGIFDVLLHQLSTSFVGHRLVVWAGIAESLTAGSICTSVVLQLKWDELNELCIQHYTTMNLILFVALYGEHL